MGATIRLSIEVKPLSLHSIQLYVWIAVRCTHKNEAIMARKKTQQQLAFDVT